MPSTAAPLVRLASGVVDTAIVAGAELLLWPDRLRRPVGISPGMQLQRLLLEGCYFVGALGLAGRTGGHALFGLRVVDQATGGRPGWRAALLWWALRQPPQALSIPLASSSRVRETTAKLREADPEAEELRRRFRGDRPRLDEAMMELYRARDIDPWSGYRPLFVAGLLAATYGCILTAGILRRPDRRGFHDRLAGVLVVRD